MDITKILVLAEFEDGSVRQVLASKLQKEAALHLLRADDGTLKVTEEIMPIELEFKEKQYGR
jgi:hypothetical protein